MLNVEKVSREKIAKTFKRHILNNVILRMDYATIFSSKELASEIVKVLGNEYPNRAEEKEMIIQVSDRTHIPLKEIDTSIFQDEHKKNTIRLNPVAITFEFKNYINFDSLYEKFSQILVIYKKLFSNNPINRIGLRKTNSYSLLEESGKLQTFNGYFNEFLTYPLKERLFDIDISDRHIYVVKNDNININLRHGTMNGSIVNDNKKQPARCFVLDIDGYSTENINVDNICNLLTSINDNIFNIFYWAMGDKLRKELTE